MPHDGTGSSGSVVAPAVFVASEKGNVAIAVAAVQESFVGGSCAPALLAHSTMDTSKRAFRLEQENIRKVYDVSLAPTVAPNNTVTRLPVQIYLCPSMLAPPGPLDAYSTHYASYALCVGNNDAWAAPPDNGAIVRSNATGNPAIIDTGKRMTDIIDGTSSTIVVGEMGYQLKDYMFTSGPYAGSLRGGNTSWAYGYTSYSCGSTRTLLNTVAPPTSVLDRLQSFRSDHSGGANFLLGDGSVQFIANSIALGTYQALGTRAGGEVAQVP